jgi:hypothetical protein
MAAHSGGFPPAPGPGQRPDWYPFGTNPNDQAYWDGHHWTAQRRWKGAAWEQIPLAPVESARSVGPGSPAPEAAWDQYRSVPPHRVSGTTHAVGPMVLLCSGVATIVGSVGSWYSVHSTLGFGGTSVAGTSHGGFGWIALISGVILVLAGAAMVFAGPAALRLLGQLAAMAAGASLGVSIYLIDRFVSAPSPIAGVGWGLILVVLASVVAAAAAVSINVA